MEWSGVGIYSKITLLSGCKLVWLGVNHGSGDLLYTYVIYIYASCTLLYPTYPTLHIYIQ